MQALALVALVSFPLVGAVVGIRLLLLARRTGRAPERCAGLGLTLLTVAGHPFCAIGRLPAFVGTPVGDALFALGLALTVAGITLLYAFTWKVFRPGSAWARALVAAAALASAVQCGGLLLATWGLDSLEAIVPRTRPWAITIILSVCGAFAWTSLEAFAYHARLRRRLALGLADPVVVNRVWLWAVSGVLAAALCGQVAVRAFQGVLVLRDPIALAVTALAGLAIGGAWYLAFLPPRGYLAWVRRRSARHAA